jgi:hypothetical protein
MTTTYREQFCPLGCDAWVRGIISQKIELFTVTPVRASNPPTEKVTAILKRAFHAISYQKDECKRLWMETSYKTILRKDETV